MGRPARKTTTRNEIVTIVLPWQLRIQWSSSKNKKKVVGEIKAWWFYSNFQGCLLFFCWPESSFFFSPQGYQDLLLIMTFLLHQISERLINFGSLFYLDLGFWIRLAVGFLPSQIATGLIRKQKLTLDLFRSRPDVEEWEGFFNKKMKEERFKESLREEVAMGKGVTFEI